MRPSVRFLPSGALFIRTENEYRLCENPAGLANFRWPQEQAPAQIELRDGASALEHFYFVAPFLEGTPALSCGDLITPAAKCAINIFGKPGFRFTRGEVGAFLLGFAPPFTVAGITSAARTLTIRLEDFWRMLPAEEQRLSWNLRIVRDPNKLDAPCEVVEETFERQPGNLRVVLQLAANGGFVLELSPC